MKIRLVVLAMTVALLSSIAVAKKVPLPAPNLSAGMKLKLSVQQECSPSSVCSADFKVSLSGVHSFNITPEQEAALQPNAQISVGIIGSSLSFLLSEDPSFQNGNKSASIKKDISLLGPAVPCDIKLKWGKGKMSVNIKAKANMKDLALMAAALKEKSKDPKAAAIFIVGTAIEHPSITTLEAVVPMASDIRVTESQGATAEGVEFTSISYDVATKFYTAP